MKTHVDRGHHDGTSLEPASRSNRHQGKAASGPRQLQQQQQIAQLQRNAPNTNRTGLPDTLKSGIEALSGMDMSGVRVHRNSDKPAALQAHAYAQGSDIHLGPGQDKHLPHEAWHVVQQAQGRVRPTASVAGKAVNDDLALEREADAKGNQARSLGAAPMPPTASPLSPHNSTRRAPLQLKPGKKTHIGVGAAIGSVVPILGTAIGALIGYGIYKHRKRRNRRNPGRQIDGTIPRLDEEEIRYQSPHTQPESYEDIGTRSSPQHPSSDVHPSKAAESLAALRRGSERSLASGDENRLALTEKEADRQGLALLPMLSSYVESDKSQGVLQNRQHSEQAKAAYQLVDGILRPLANDQETLTTTDRDISSPEAMMKVLLNSGIHEDELFKMNQEQMEEKARELGGSYIYVMNSSGQIFAGEEELSVTHHSTFLAGGAVACAGYIRVRKGIIEKVSNVSGHYKPGPAYLWQALLSMQSHGVDLNKVEVQILNVDKKFDSAADFLESFNPIRSPEMFNTAQAVEYLNAL